jgi:hypothetical protein
MNFTPRAATSGSGRARLAELPNTSTSAIVEIVVSTGRAGAKQTHRFGGSLYPPRRNVRRDESGRFMQRPVPSD